MVHDNVYQVSIFHLCYCDKQVDKCISSQVYVLCYPYYHVIHDI